MGDNKGMKAEMNDANKCCLPASNTSDYSGRPEVIARPFLILRGGPEKMQASCERGGYRPRRALQFERHAVSFATA
jgi:hypothetical protein